MFMDRLYYVQHLYFMVMLMICHIGLIAFIKKRSARNKSNRKKQYTNMPMVRNQCMFFSRYCWIVCNYIVRYRRRSISI